MGVVYLAYDRLRRRPVALKRVSLQPGLDLSKADNDELAFATTRFLEPPLPQEDGTRWEADWQARHHAVRRMEHRALLEDKEPDAGSSERREYLQLALAREFRALASLRHPNIVSVLDYGFDSRGEPFLTMELLHGAQPLLSFSDSNLRVKYRLIRQLVDALAYLHRHGVVHRDLKPDNVVVLGDSDSPCVKLLDFGIAVVGGQAESMAGTLDYMAPEVLQDGPPTAAADIYALGVVAYELLTGSHPYRSDSGLETAVSAVRHTVDVEPLPANADVCHLIALMLSKTPANRPASEALREEWRKAAKLKSGRVRTGESFHRAARFVARDSELRTLSRALDRTREGKGEAWFVTGPTGVGKSRLLDELQTRALVDGVTVVRGQAVDTARREFHVWRHVLRQLVLQEEPNQLEKSVLSGLIEDLSALIEAEAPAAPSLEPAQNFVRTLNVVDSLFARLNEPVLIILEDLHWASQESLALLERVIERIQERPHLLVVAVRTEAVGRTEAETALPTSNPETDDSSLGDSEAPQTLFNSGLQACHELQSRHSHVRELELAPLDENGLESLVESILGSPLLPDDLRQLLEKRPQHGNIYHLIEMLRAYAESRQSVVEAMLDNGLHGLLKVRLNAIGPSARTALNRAAVAGRLLNIELLKRFGHVDQMLTDASRAGILELHGERWRFAHDSVRDLLLNELDPKRKCELHVQLANALEAVSDGETHATEIAYHFLAANRGEWAVPHLVVAAEHALHCGALHDAIHQATTVLSLADSDAVSLLQEARATRALSLAQYGIGQPSQTIETVMRLVERLELTPPNSTVGRIASIAKQAMLITTGKLSPSSAHRVVGGSREFWEVMVEAIFACFTAMMWAGKPLQAVYLAELNMLASRAFGFKEQFLVSQVGIAYVTSLSPLAPAFRSYFNRGYGEQSTYTRYRYWMMADSLYHLHAGHWDTAVAHSNELAVEAREAGDEECEAFALANLCTLHHFRGEWRAEATTLRSLRSLMSGSASNQIRAWYYHRKGSQCFRDGELLTARDLLTEGVTLSKAAGDQISEVFTRGELCLLMYELGESASARHLVLANVEAMSGGSLLGHGGIFGLPATLKVARHLLHRNHANDELKEASRRLRRIVTRYGLQIPIVRHLIPWQRGLDAAARKRWRIARRLLKRAAASASKVGALLPEGRIRLDLARVERLSGREEKAEAQLVLSQVRLTSAHALYDLDRLEQIRSLPPSALELL